MGGIDTINWRIGRKYKLHNFFGTKLSTTLTTNAIESDEIEEIPILSDDVIKSTLIMKKR